MHKYFVSKDETMESIYARQGLEPKTLSGIAKRGLVEVQRDEYEIVRLLQTYGYGRIKEVIEKWK